MSAITVLLLITNLNVDHYAVRTMACPLRRWTVTMQISYTHIEETGIPQKNIICGYLVHMDTTYNLTP
jgi:hypothetical protein